MPLCHDPLYSAGVLGNRCYDELDHDDCEPGFIDRGFGCEPENNSNDNSNNDNEDRDPVLQVCPPRCGIGSNDDNDNDSDSENSSSDNNDPNEEFFEDRPFFD